MDDGRRRDLLETAALETGFDAAGWAAATVQARDLATFAGWLERGMHAGMDYLPRSLGRRADLGSSLPGARAVLALAVSHAHPDPDVPAGGTRIGRVARYAWSPDYHAALEPHLTRLTGVAANLGVRARAYVDHGPILERALGVSAGLGWRGRSSQLVSTRLGALTTLCVLLTDLEPPRDAGHPDRCGTCVSCVTGCPTDAITPERAVDARRCLAYYTVEHRGPIPFEFRAAMGDHLFGCDDCLDVCPWTVRAGPLSGLLAPDPELAHPDLEPFFTLSGKEFERRYAHTAFARARRRGMARNAAVVLGNTGDSRHLPLLERGLADPAADVREASAWGLGRLAGNARARQVLERGLADPDPAVRATTKAGLEGLLRVFTAERDLGSY